MSNERDPAMSKCLVQCCKFSSTPESRFSFIAKVTTFTLSGNTSSYYQFVNTKVRVHRMFIDWLIEAQYIYLRIFIQLSKIPHFTTLQKFAGRIAGTVTGKDNLFIYFTYTGKAHLLWHRFIGV